MNVSFEEKSVWVTLVGMVVVFGAYFAMALHMDRAGFTELIAYVPLFAAAVVALIVVLVVGHALAAIGGAEGRDERDRLIGWRAESNSSWVLGTGVILAITGMIFAVPNVWVAHLLLASLIAAEIVKAVAQLVYYRRGM